MIPDGYILTPHDGGRGRERIKGEPHEESGLRQEVDFLGFEEIIRKESGVKVVLEVRHCYINAPISKLLMTQSYIIIS